MIVPVLSMSIILLCSLMIWNHYTSTTTKISGSPWTQGNSPPIQIKDTVVQVDNKDKNYVWEGDSILFGTTIPANGHTIFQINDKNEVLLTISEKGIITIEGKEVATSPRIAKALKKSYLLESAP